MNRDPLQPRSRAELVAEYGEEVVEWAEDYLAEHDSRDEMDRHCP